MRSHATIAVTAAIAAVTLASGASTAFAQEDVKPTSREVTKLSAPDAEVAAAAERIASEGSALGSYWDSDRGELVVVVGPDSSIGDAEAEKLAEGPARLQRHDITNKTVDAIREQIAERAFSSEAEKFSYASHLDLQTGKVVLETDAPAPVTDPLIEEFPEAIERRDGKPVQDLFHRRDDISPFWGGASIQSGGRHQQLRIRGSQAVGSAAHEHRGPLLRRRRDRPHAVQPARRHGHRAAARWARSSSGTAATWSSSAAVVQPGVYVGGIFSTSSKAVVGANDPVAGVTGYCASGQTTGEQCNQNRAEHGGHRLHANLLQVAG